MYKLIELKYILFDLLYIFKRRMVRKEAKYVAKSYTLRTY